MDQPIRSRETTAEVLECGCTRSYHKIAGRFIEQPCRHELAALAQLQKQKADRKAL